MKIFYNWMATRMRSPRQSRAVNSQQKDIILINHYAGSPEMGMEFRPYYMMKKLKEKGVSSLTITADYSHLRIEQPKQLGYTQREGLDYYVVGTCKYQGNGIKRLASMLLFAVKLVWKSSSFAKKHKPKAVIASSTHPLDIFGAFCIAKFAQAKLIFEIHDLWPLSPIIIGGMSKYHPFIIMMRCAEWFAYKASDEIISILPGTYTHVAKDGVSKERWHYIPNGYVPDVQHKSSNAIAVQKIDAKYKIMFVGGLVPSSNIQFIIDVMAQIPDAALIIVGDGPLRAELQKHPNVHFTGQVPKNEVQDMLKHADYCVFSLIHSKLYEYGTSLNKLCDYMHAKKPIIQLAPHYNTEVEQSGCGVVIDAVDAKIAAESLTQWLANTTNAKELGELGYQFLKQKRDYDKLSEKFIKTIT